MKSPTYFTIDDVISMLKKKQGERSVNDLAEEIGVSLRYIYNIFSGVRSPGRDVLDYLGLERVTVFRKV